jgi:hypothetical protein
MLGVIVELAHDLGERRSHDLDHGSREAAVRQLLLYELDAALVIREENLFLCREVPKECPRRYPRGDGNLGNRDLLESTLSKKFASR